ncbi:MAG: trigger factor [Elusimicrobia bacterium]|nr:trigger factor [Elusimicrobiota bacterium]
MALFAGIGSSDKPTFKKLKENGCEVSLSLTIPAALAQDAQHSALARLQQRARLPGFRPGKAPLDIVKKNLEGRLRQEVIEDLLEKHLPSALKELSLEPVATPIATSISLEDGKPFKAEIKVEIPPRFVPKDYAKISVKKTPHPADEESITKRLTDLREAHARLEKADEEAVGAGHYAVIDYQGIQNGKPSPDIKGEAELVDLSSEQLTEGLAQGLLGMKRGETKEIAVKIQDRAVSLSTTVREIKKKVLPELDAEFAKDMGFTALDELKAKIKEVIEEEGRKKTEEEISAQIEKALLEANKFPVPPSMLSHRLEHRLERIKGQMRIPEEQWAGKMGKELEDKIRPLVESELRMGYILAAVAEKEKIAATDEDIKSELDKDLGQAKTPADAEEIKKFYERRREDIAAMLRERKTLAFIREKASVA